MARFDFPFEINYENILKTIQNLVLTSREQPTKSTSRTSSTTQGTTATRGYCWTHGICSHTSAACQRPAIGHVPAATAENPQGGATSKWSNRK